MDPITMAGVGLALAAIVISTIMDGNSFGPLIGPSSIVLVLLGAIGGGMCAFTKDDLKSLPKSLVLAFTGAPMNADDAVTTLVNLAEVARREGVLALEQRVKDVDDDFMRTGLQMIVDGADEEDVQTVMEIELDSLDARHGRNIAFWNALAGYAPTFGMLGTVIGLINMLGNLSDASALGRGMAMALLTTLYGVMFANLFFLPVAGKLQRLHDAEVAARAVTVDGVMAIRSGVSPRALAERLEAHLDRSDRVGYAERAGKQAA